MTPICHATFNPPGHWFGQKLHACFMDHMSFSSCFLLLPAHTASSLCAFIHVFSAPHSAPPSCGEPWAWHAGRAMVTWWPRSLSGGSWCGWSVQPVLGLLPPCGDPSPPRCPGLPVAPALCCLHVQPLISRRKENLPGAARLPSAHTPISIRTCLSASQPLNLSTSQLLSEETISSLPSRHVFALL